MTHWCWPHFVMTHETCSTCSTKSQIRTDGIIQTSPVEAINRLKDLPIWLKVVTTLEKPQPPLTIASQTMWRSSHEDFKMAKADDNMFNSLWPIDAIWWQISWLVNIGSGNCLPPNHYLNQYWLNIKCVLWRSPQKNFARSAHELNL